ncbi:MAG: hypothetical protein Kow00121_03960 [Elainellaceae cyanobacterium]
MPVNPNGNEFRVNTTTQGDQVTYSVAPPSPAQGMVKAVAVDADGDYVVVWSSQGEDDPGFATEWGVYAQRYSKDGTPAPGGPILVNASHTTFGEQLAASVAMDADGGFVVTWSSQFSGQPLDAAGFGVFAKRYDSNGIAKDAPEHFRVNTTTSGNQFNSSIAMQADGGFIITWTGDRSGQGTNVYAQRYGSNGSAVGGEINVNTFTTGDQRNSSIAVDGSGRFIVVWEGSGEGGAGSDVYAQLFAADGSKLGSEFRINVTTANDQKHASVAVDADGDFVVTWSSLDATNGQDVYARRFKIDEAVATKFTAKDATDVLINRTQFGNQQYSSVVMDANGNYVITWTDDRAEGQVSNGVFARRYRANGSLYPEDQTDPNQGVFRVNNVTANNQEFSSIGMDGTGNFIIAWTSENQDSTNTTGVYARRYTATTSTNNTPTDITLAPSSVSEAAAIGVAVGSLTTADLDAADTHIYTLVDGGLDNDKFVIVGNQLRVNAPLDFETKPTYSVRIKTDDQNGGEFIEDIIITTVNVNEAPTQPSLSSSTVAEGAIANSLVGTLNATDPEGLALTYTLVGGLADNAAFKIVGNQLQVNALQNPDTKPTYTIRVAATDPGGLSSTQDFTIVVNRAPSGFSISSSSIIENSAIGTVVGDLSATDPEGNTPITFQLVTGVADNAAFTIVGNQLRVNAPLDFETKNAYTLKLRISDSTGSSRIIDVPIAITDNAAPTNLGISSSQILNTTPVGGNVGTLTAVDAEDDIPITFELVGGVADNAAFTIDSATNTLKVNAALTKSTYNLQIRTTDDQGETSVSPITITVVDNQAPGNLTIDNSKILENSAIGTTIGTLSATDPENNTPITFALVEGVADNAPFILENGILKVNGPIDFEAKPTYVLKVRVTDSAGSTQVLDLPIEIIDNQAPSAAQITSTQVLETAAIGTVVGALNATDPEGNNPITFTLVNGVADNAAFTIVGNQLRVNTDFDVSVKSTYDLQIRTVDSAGEFRISPLTITVVSNQAPGDLTIDNSQIIETAAVGTTIGTLGATDPEGNTPITFALVDGVADNAPFVLENGVLKVKTALDFETKPAYTLKVRVTDSAGSSQILDLPIEIIDNQAPIAPSLSNSQILDTAAIGSLVGTLASIDPEGNNPVSFTLVDGAADNAAFTLTGNQLRVNTALDSAVKDTYTLQIRTADAFGEFRVSTLMVTVVDNQAPGNLTITNSEIIESAAIGTTIGTLSATDPEGDTPITFALVTGVADNAPFILENGVLKVNAPLDFETKNIYTLQVRVTDATGANQIFNVPIQIQDNQAPAVPTIDNTKVLDTAAIGTDIGTLTTTDPEGNTPITFALVDGVPDNAPFRIVGNKLQVNGALEGSVKSNYTLQVRTTDAAGESRISTLAIEVIDNQPPASLTIDNSQIIENSAIGTAIGTLSAIDPENNTPISFALVDEVADNAAFKIVGNELQVNGPLNFEAKKTYTLKVRVSDGAGVSQVLDLPITITNQNEAPDGVAIDSSEILETAAIGDEVGTLSATDPEGNGPFTYTLVDGVADNAAFRIVGDKLQVNAPLNFEAKPEYTLKVRVADGAGLGQVLDLTITIGDQNEPPVNLSISDSEVDENSPIGTVIGTLNATDPENDLPLEFELVDGVADNSPFTIVGNELRVNAGLDFETKTTYTLQVRVTDAKGSTTTMPLVITVADINEAPINLLLTPAAVDENSAIGTTVGTLSATDPEGDTPITFALVDGVADNAAFTLTGNTLKVNGSLDFEEKPTYTLQVRVTSGAAGRQVSQIVPLTVTLNDLPELPGQTAPTDITLTPSAVNENVAAGTQVGTLTTADPDNINGDTHTYTLVAGAGDTDNGQFTLSADGKLSVNFSPDFELKKTYSIRVQTKDRGNKTFEKVLTVSINDLPELPGQTAPTDISLSASSVNENVPIGTAVGTFSTADPDNINGDTHTYTLVAGTGSTDNSRFAITATGQLQILEIPDFESAKKSYSIRVRSTDQGGKFTEKTFTVAVNDLPENPGDTDPRDILLSANAVNENVPAGSQFGNFSTVDPDAGDTHTYALVTGTGSIDNSAFTLTADGKLSINASPDFETKQTYSIRVRTTDRGNRSFEKVFTISVNNLPENPGDTDPRDILLSDNTVDENAPAGAQFGSFSTVDPDFNDVHTYTLVSGAGSIDNSAFTLTADGKLSINASPDFETKQTYSIRVRTTDVGNRSFEKVFTIAVSNVNEAPIVSLSSGAVVYTEKSAAIAIDPAALVTDIDSTTLTKATIAIGGYTAGQDLLGFANQAGITGNFDTATGVLTLTGNASIAAYQTALRSITYRNTSNSPNLANRSIRFTVTDGSANSAQVARTIQITPVNDAPTVTTSAGALSYAENAGAVAVDSGVLVNDIDSPNLAGATVTVGGYIAGQDQLSFTSQGGINGNFDAATGVLTLTGIASVASYQAVLRSITYSNISDNPTLTNRVVQFSVTDRALTSNLASRTVQIRAVNTAPVLTASTGALAYQENAGAVAVDPGLIVTDSDSPNLTRATLVLSGYVAGQDRLNFTNQNGIVGNFNAATGVLTLTGSASVARYQSALRSVTYSNSSNSPNTGNRTLRITVTDGIATSNLATRPIQVISVNDAPVVTPSVPSVAFPHNSGAVTLDPGLVLADVDSASLKGATIALKGYIPGEDTLLFNDQKGITGSFDAASGVLTLTGNAALADYRTALRSIVYANNSDSPTVKTRTLEISATDGISSSDPSKAKIQIRFDGSNALPVLDINGSGAGVDFSSTFVISGPAVPVSATDSKLTDADSAVLLSAQVVISNPHNWQQEELLVNTQGTAIKAAYNRGQGTLNLTGTAPVATYLKVLRSIQYQNYSSTPDRTTRTILFSVNDGINRSEPAQTTVQITQVNLLNQGTPGNDSLVTTPATDLINAHAGNDTLTSILAYLQQNDQIDGGSGIDTFVLTNGAGNAIVDINNPANQIGGIVAGKTAITNFEYFNFSGFTGNATMIGSNGLSNQLTGGAGNDVISGGVSNDRLTGNSGNDTLNGGIGNDTLNGGLGDDTYVVDSIGDQIIEAIDTGFDTIISSISWTLGEHFDDLTLVGNAIVGIGNDLNNAITGNDLNNSLAGRSGNDILIGLGGNDFLSGEAGNDDLQGGSGRDRIVAGSSNDRIDGGQGKDRVTGGEGKDKFYIAKARKKDMDIITDFNPADDTIQISRAGFNRRLRLGKVKANQFVTGSQAADDSDRFIYNQSAGALFFDADGLGGTSQIQIARLKNRADLTRLDIAIVQ